MRPAGYFAGALFLLLSVGFLVFPKKIQQGCIDYFSKKKQTKYVMQKLNYATSDLFLYSILISGVLCLLMLLVVILGAIYGVDAYPELP